jgi:hypothetical protein
VHRFLLPDAPHTLPVCTAFAHRFQRGPVAVVCDLHVVLLRNPLRMADPGDRDVRRELFRLFIDARKLGVMVDGVHRELTDEDIARIAGTYHAWRGDRSSPSPSMGEGRGEGGSPVLEE